MDCVGLPESESVSSLSEDLQRSYLRSAVRSVDVLDGIIQGDISQSKKDML